MDTISTTYNLHETFAAKKIEYIKDVQNFKAKPVYNHSPKQPVSRRILGSQRTEFLTVVCDESGISGHLEIPLIRGYALSYTHPLSDLRNARGIAQQGKEYLRKLDIQTLAGILIILANDYNLFRYQPADTGAQKNAIVRTAGKETIITAILVIEDSVNSGNYAYLPKLALILDTLVTVGGIQTRMQEWLKLVIAAIYRPDTEVWDENSTAQKIARQKKMAINKEEKLAEIAQRKQTKLLKDDCKLAHTCIKDLYKAEKISPKFRMFLGNVFQEFQLLTMENGAKALLISKLDSIVDPSASKLIEILKANRSGIAAKEETMNEFFELDEPKEEKIQVVRKTESSETVTVYSVETTIEVAEGEKLITLNGKQYVVNAAEYDSLSFLERIKRNKAIIAGVFNHV